MWINLPHLDNSFPEYEEAWKMVRSVLTADKEVVVVMLITRSTAATQHIFEALTEFGQDPNYEIKVNGRMHCSYPGQNNGRGEKRIEVQITTTVGGEEE